MLNMLQGVQQRTAGNQHNSQKRVSSYGGRAYALAHDGVLFQRCGSGSSVSSSVWRPGRSHAGTADAVQKPLCRVPIEIEHRCFQSSKGDRSRGLEIKKFTQRGAQTMAGHQLGQEPYRNCGSVLSADFDHAVAAVVQT